MSRYLDTEADNYFPVRPARTSQRPPPRRTNPPRETVPRVVFSKRAHGLASREIVGTILRRRPEICCLVRQPDGEISSRCIFYRDSFDALTRAIELIRLGHLGAAKAGCGQPSVSGMYLEIHARVSHDKARVEAVFRNKFDKRMGAPIIFVGEDIAALARALAWAQTIGGGR